jgi:flagellar basal-body rod modification protein FlgD
MSVNSTNGTTGAAGTAGSQAQQAANAAAQSLSGNFNTFLTLLTAQIQNQDPLQPMDSTQFTQQLVEMTGVQETIATNQNLAQLLTLTQASQSANLVNYIGTTVTANGNATSLSNGQANWQYQLPTAAQNVTLTVANSSGATVFTQAGTTNEGSNSFSWNGSTTSGAQAPDGIYTLSVAATGANGSAITATTQVSGQVTGVETDSGQQFLDIGSSKVEPSAVLSVSGSASSTTSSAITSLVNALTGI